MDCSSEEQIIRMKLDGLTNIVSLVFDISNRQLTVFHEGSYDQVKLLINAKPIVLQPFSQY